MKRFCVITNRDKDEQYREAQYIKTYLEERGGICDVLDNTRSQEAGVRHFTKVEEISPDTQCALVLGGDGTMIQAAIDLVHRNLPILGINLGTVGFLTEVEQQNLEQALTMLLQDEYTVENRIMLKETGSRQGGEQSCYALNDVVVSKRGECRLITVKVYINEELADIYRADGLIVSTPTGSTGYNLSAGGPVMVPHAHVAVITPICAHSLNKRSLVVSAGDHITLELGQTKEVQKDTALLVVDGRNVRHLETGDRLDICVPEDTTQLIKLSGISFYKKMRDKLNNN
jgi:NAD+ kinase